MNAFVYLAAFASMASMRLCDAMLPALGRSFDIPAADASWTISGFALAYGVMQLFFGPLGDRFGKPRVIAVAASACGLTALGAALAGNFTFLVLSRVAMGAAAAGIIPLCMAWIGDTVTWERRQVALAGLLSYTLLGLMTGAWIGGAVSESIGWRWTFAGMAVIFLGLGASLWRQARHLRVIEAASSHMSRLRSVCADSSARQLLGMAFLEGALVFGSLAFVPTILHARLAMSLSSAGATLALFGLGGLVYSRLAGRMLGRLGAHRMATAGAVAVAVALFTLAGSTLWVSAAAACFMAGLGFYMLHNTLQARATQLSSTARGTAVSLFVCALFLGQSAGIASMGWLINVFPAELLIGANAIAMMALATYLAVTTRTVQPART